MSSQGTTEGSSPFVLRNRRGDEPESDEVETVEAEPTEPEGEAAEAEIEAAADVEAQSDEAQSVEAQSVEAADEPSGPSKLDSAPPGPERRLVAGAEPWVWGVLAVAVVALVFGIVQWLGSGPTSQEQRAGLRDQAVIQGTHAVETLQSMDYRAIDEGVTRWQEVTTGVLHDQFKAISQDQRDGIEQAAKITTARVVQAGLTELGEDSATMIASTEVTVASTDTSVEPAIKRNRWAAELSLVKGEWKIENIQQVSVNVS